MRFQYKTQILVELVKNQNLYISALYRRVIIWGLFLIWKWSRFPRKSAPKQHLFTYLWNKKRQTGLFQLVCLFWWRRPVTAHYRILNEMPIVGKIGTDAGTVRQFKKHCSCPFSPTPSFHNRETAFIDPRDH